MKLPRVLWLVALIVLLGRAETAFGIYLFEPFNSMASTLANGWQTNYNYGRDGTFYVPAVAAVCDTDQIPTYFTNVNGLATWRGVPNVNNTAYQSIWIGRQYRYTNTTFTASATKPFGYEILRRNAWVDPVGSCRETGANPSSRQQAEVSIWLYQEMTLGGDLQPYPNSLDFGEYDQGVTPGTGNTITNNTSKWVIYDGVQRGIDLTNAIGPMGETVNLSANSLPGGTNLNWFYQDHLGGTNNTNALAFRITHDGSTVRFFINANPLSNPSCGFPNAMIQVDSRSVAWNSNIGIMFGQGINRFDQEFAWGEFDYVLVRSAADESYFLDYRREEWFGLRKTLRHEIHLSAKVEEHEAGIGEITLCKPKDSGKWNESSLTLMRAGASIPLVFAAKDPPPGMASVVRLKNNDLMIRFHKATRQTSEVWNGDGELTLTVSHEAGLFAANEPLEVYVDNEQFADTAPSSSTHVNGVDYATVGRAKSIWRQEKEEAPMIVEQKRSGGQAPQNAKLAN